MFTTIKKEDGEASMFHLPAVRWEITIKGKECVSMRQYGKPWVQKIAHK